MNFDATIQTLFNELKQKKCIDFYVDKPVARNILVGSIYKKFDSLCEWIKSLTRDLFFMVRLTYAPFSGTNWDHDADVATLQSRISQQQMKMWEFLQKFWSDFLLNGEKPRTELELLSDIKTTKESIFKALEVKGQEPDLTWAIFLRWSQKNSAIRSDAFATIKEKHLKAYKMFYKDLLLLLPVSRQVSGDEIFSSVQKPQGVLFEKVFQPIFGSLFGRPKSHLS